jgi:prevent-host-death family protein
MKTIGVTELRQRAAEVIEDVRESTEPTLVLQRSQKVAYLVGVDRYESDQAELQAARRALFLREVREAEAEYAAGSSAGPEDVEALIRDIKS